MSSNILNQVAYLRTSRSFPSDQQALVVEIDKSYVDIANAVNSRTIGLFATNRASITGEQWFIDNSNSQLQKQQTLRQVYQFTASGTIAHGINLSQIAGFTKIYGTFTDGTNWYPLPYVNTTSINNQILLKITPTNIEITSGSGSPPTITSGFVVLEWLAKV